MAPLTRSILAGSAVLIAAACAEGITSSDLGNSELAAAFNTTLLGFSATTNSFNASSDSVGHAYKPEGGGHGGQGAHPGGGPGGPGGDFMGGFGGDFLGGPHDGRGPFGGGLPSDCTFNAGTGQITCPAVTHDGLTIVRSGSYGYHAAIYAGVPAANHAFKVAAPILEELRGDPA